VAVFLLVRLFLDTIWVHRIRQLECYLVRWLQWLNYVLLQVWVDPWFLMVSQQCPLAHTCRRLQCLTLLLASATKLPVAQLFQCNKSWHLLAECHNVRQWLLS
jgi:hypothetical protein